MTAPVALVTGVAGQDGSYLAERLLRDGYAVHGLVRAGDTVDTLPPEVRLHVGDLADREALRGLVDDVEPDEVYNLGGLSSVAASWQAPEETVAVSGAAVVTLLQACLQLQQRRGREVRLLQASSAEMFGEPARSPQDEDTPVAPVSPYGAAKALAHHACGVFRHHGLFATSLVLYNHESPRRPRTFVTRKISSGVADIVRAGGGELALGNLAARRDWGWAPDYVDAMVRAMRHTAPETFVVATGVSRTVEDFVAAAFAHVGIEDWRAHVRVDPALFVPVDPSEQRGDASKARRLLQWRPTVTFDGLVAALVDADLAEGSR